MQLYKAAPLIAVVASFLAGCGDLDDMMAETEPSRSPASAAPTASSADGDQPQSEDEEGGGRYYHIEWGRYTGNPPRGVPKEIALDVMVNELSVQGIDISAPTAVEHADRICDYVNSGRYYYDLIDDIQAEDAAGRQAMDGISNQDLVAYLPLAIGAYCPAAGLRIFGNNLPTR